MNWRTFLTALGAVALGAMAWRAGRGLGLALLASGLLLWFLLYYTRLLTIMKRANERPIGYIGSAVMLNVKLKTGLSLLHVVALTRALGERLSPEGAQPEVYRWSDPGNSHVVAEFAGGRLVHWRLERPQEPPPESAPPPDA